MPSWIILCCCCVLLSLAESIASAQSPAPALTDYARAPSPAYAYERTPDTTHEHLSDTTHERTGWVIQTGTFTPQERQKALLDRPLQAQGTPGRPIEMSVLERDWMDLYRLLSVPARQQMRVSNPALCTGDPETFSELLEQASKSIDLQDYQTARKHLTDARDAVACTPERIQTNALTRYFFLLDSMDILDGGSTPEHYQRVFAIDSNFKCPQDYPEAIVAACSQAAHNPQALMARTIPRGAVALEGMSLQLDGRKCEPGTLLQLATGQHLIQWVDERMGDANARGVSASWLMWPPPGEQELRWPPEALVPPTASALGESLMTHAAQGALTAEETERLREVLRFRNQPWLVILSRLERQKSLQSLWILADGSVEMRSMSQSDGVSFISRLPPHWKRPGQVMATGFAATTAVATGWYTHTRWDLENTLYTSLEEGNQARARGQTLAAVSLSCATAALLTGTIAWWMPSTTGASHATHRLSSDRTSASTMASLPFPGRAGHAQRFTFRPMLGFYATLEPSGLSPAIRLESTW